MHVDSLNQIIADNSSHDTSVATAYLAMSEALYNSNFDTVIPLCEKSIQIAERGLDKNPPKAVRDVFLRLISLDYNNIGFIHKKKGEKKEAIENYEKALAMQQKLGDKDAISNSLTNIGTYYYQQGETKKALDYYGKSVRIQEEAGNKKGLAVALNNIGSIYKRLGDMTLALEYYHKSLKIKKEIGDQEGIATSLNNLGFFYRNQNEYEKALSYYEESLEIHSKNNSKDGLAYVLANIGTLYQHQGKSDEALEFFNKSLAIRYEIRDKEGIASSLNNIGMLYKKTGNIEKAEEFIEKGLRIREEMGDKRGVSTSLTNLGGIYFAQGKFQKAKNHGLKSMQIAKELGYPQIIKDASTLLLQVYEHENNGTKALEMYRLYITMRDSINNQETHSMAANQQAKYEYEKQKTIDDANYEKQKTIEEARNEREKLKEEAKYEKRIQEEREEKKKQKRIIYTGIVALILLIGIVIFTVNRLKITDRQKSIIENQKATVELAHAELEGKNKEITDSINYAKRIQSSILPSDSTVKESFPDSFILYKPKDIVAGDFYWLEKKEGKILLAVADCTGHGVPGALVSVFCSNGLNRSVREHAIIDPGKILDKTRTIVIDEFNKSSAEVEESRFHKVKDGMDIALCSFEGKHLQYAGANNPLWIIRNGEIIEAKADKQPIGQFDSPEPYTTHDFDLVAGDSIYMFTDGYVDQFGGGLNGAKGKKFKAKALKELLLGIQDKSMNIQKGIIDETFEAWKGDMEQIDDVCMIGVRV